MARSLTRLLIENHLSEGICVPGQEIGLTIDQTLTQDATGTMAGLQFETLGIDRVRTQVSVSYIDHNTLQVGYENADDHRYLETMAARYGLYVSRAGNGICHQVHLERFGQPGATLLGADSHTPSAGALAMFAVGAGGLDVARAMAGMPFFLSYPQVCAINLQGSLSPWVSAKDVILHILRLFGTKGNVGWVFEYCGSGVAALTVNQRATICNMGAECGVTTSLFPSDEQTRLYLEARGRGPVWREMSAEPGSEYDRSIDVDLSSIEPLLAQPHSPGNIAYVRECAGLKVDQVCVGSCTNSSFHDLAVLATMLRGRSVPDGLSLVVTPGSRQVLLAIDKAGYLADLLAAGARLVEPCCGFCIGSGHSPGSAAVSLRTSNRNFEGRSGTADAAVYLASPETAAATVLRGALVDPRDLGLDYPQVIEPELYARDDSLLQKPLAEVQASSVQVQRGPNIGKPPRCQPLPEELSVWVAIKVGHRITTDHIMPAGSRMKYRSNIDTYADYVFEQVDGGFSARARQWQAQGRNSAIVAGWSYGQGSSREHAAICPASLGVRLVLALSFERIHAANLVNFGILPLSFCNEEDYENIALGECLHIKLNRERLCKESTISVELGDGRFLALRHDLSQRQVSVVLAGGALSSNAMY